MNKVKEKIKNDITLCCEIFNVKDEQAYKNKTSLAIQISQKYGKGQHLLIANKKIGIGRSKKYCSIDEFKANGLTFEDIDYSKIMKDFKRFVSRPIIKKKKENYQTKLII